MKVIVLGSGGQLGSEFKEKMSFNNNWQFLSEKDLDITSYNELNHFFSIYSFQIIINCAAYTNVDKAEKEESKAFSVNEKGIKNIIKICILKDIKLIHFSTDYVFDGLSSKPYTEIDIPNPKSIYGKSKLAGEKIIKDSNVKSIIIRTAWVFSIYGKNFVKTMLNIAKENQNLSVVADQFGSPTYASDLADATLEILKSNDYVWKCGDIFHFSNYGKCSWYDFAREIFNSNKIDIDLKKISSSDFDSKVKRPKFSYLNSEKISKKFDLDIRHWKDALYSMNKKIIL